MVSEHDEWDRVHGIELVNNRVGERQSGRVERRVQFVSLSYGQLPIHLDHALLSFVIAAKCKQGGCLRSQRSDRPAGVHQVY